jgi:hypothetical protein
MAQVKRTSKSRLRNKTVPVLGIAGLSLAVAGSGASASITGSVADIQSKNTGARQVITLGEEEIFDVSLSTFYVFDKENAAGPQGEKVARGGGCGCGGCRCGGGGCRCGGGGCRCGWAGCSGCGCGGCCASWGYCRYC